MRVLIYGGSFNPPHLGHAEALRAAAEALQPDRCMVIPAKTPPHKELDEASPTPEQRVELSKYAFSDIACAEVSDLELRREGKSYTVFTLREIAAMYPMAELYFLVGTDMLDTIETWYHFREIFSLCTPVAISRNQGEFARLEETAARLRSEYGARIVLIRKPPLPMDSTSLRDCLCRREGRERLRDEVYSEIIRHRYYGAKPDLAWLREKAYAFLKPTRVRHVQGCEMEAVRLAELWGEDPGDAAEAAILHDITKKQTAEEQLRLCEKYGIITDNSEREAPGILHARTGAAVARDLFGVTDRVYGAIERHTTGSPGMSRLDKIIYLADFTEPTRSFDGLERVRELTAADLDRAMIEALRLSMEEVRSRGAVPHPRSADTLSWLLSEVDKNETTRREGLFRRTDQKEKKTQ